MISSLLQFLFPLSDQARITYNRSRSLKKKIQHIFEIMIILLIVIFFRALGHRITVKVSRLLCQFIGWTGFFNNTIDQNLTLIYPDKSQQEKKQIMLGAWRNLGQVAADYLFFKQMFQQKKTFDIAGLEHLDILKEKNAIFFTSHSSSWEIIRLALYHHNIHSGLVYRAFNNPYFDHIARYMMDYGFAPIFHKGSKGVRQMMRYIRQNNNMLILVDQHFSGGAYLPFLGKKAYTVPSIADIAHTYNIALIPIFVSRQQNNSYKVHIHKPLNLDQERHHIIQDMNDVISNHIFEYPHEWFWHHNRWK